MLDLQSTVLIGTSSYGLLLAEVIHRRGCRKDLALKRGIFGSERWGGKMRGRIQSLLGIDTFEEIAAQRMQLLSPLLAEDVDAARARKLKTQICAQTGISERTLRRYLAQYRGNGFGGLKPKGKGERLNRDAIPAHILEQAILLGSYRGRGFNSFYFSPNSKDPWFI
ncbi:MAG: helix-turn-helix domain-containing protein [Eubacteriales bacterium]|nr:helix-turn-helix domain-containing protein [Eubacteriales bacterium]MDZ7610209.1 helix-turn-helix domain-containing protein [Eubacteriales bacterium]